MGVRVKICGIADEVGFDAARGAGADWVGFVFFPPSPRFVTPARAAAIAARTEGGPLRVGLFVDPTEAEIAATLDVLALDVLQIYASGSRVAFFRRRFGRVVWHPVGVSGAGDLPRAREADIDRVLIEAKPPREASQPGGNAARLDWAILADWEAPMPWMLGGGLTPENVVTAIRASGATAVDVSSGVERSRGHKDPDLIARFVARARRA